MPSSWAASSKRVNSPLSNVTTSCGGISDDSCGEADQVGEGDRDLGEAVGDPCSPPRSRLAIGAGRTLSSSSSFSRFLFSMTTFFSRSSSTMPLKAEHSWPISSRVRTGTLGAVVAGSEALHPGGELAQRPEQRARKPGGGGDHHEQRQSADDHQIAAQLVDRREGLGGVDLGDERPLDAGNRERSP